MAGHMSVLDIDIAKLVFHVGGMMTPGTWCSGSALPGVSYDLFWLICSRSAWGWKPVAVPIPERGMFASLARLADRPALRQSRREVAEARCPPCRSHL